MIIVMLFMLLAPGLIALRILWKDKAISAADYKKEMGVMICI